MSIQTAISNLKQRILSSYAELSAAGIAPPSDIDDQNTHNLPEYIRRLGEQQIDGNACIFDNFQNSFTHQASINVIKSNSKIETIVFNDSHVELPDVVAMQPIVGNFYFEGEDTRLPKDNFTYVGKHLYSMENDEPLYFTYENIIAYNASLSGTIGNMRKGAYFIVDIVYFDDTEEHIEYGSSTADQKNVDITQSFTDVKKLSLTLQCRNIKKQTIRLNGNQITLTVGLNEFILSEDSEFVVSTLEMDA